MFALLRRHSVTLTAAALSFTLVAVMVTRVTDAAFSATTDNTANAFSAGTVTLTDDGGATAMFPVTDPDMGPGDSTVNCIQVTYGGTLDPTAVKLYSGGYTDSGTFASHLDVTVEEGTGATFGDCASFVTASTIFTGTLAAFDTTHTAYANGAGTWDPSASGQTRSYRFTVTLNSAVPNTQQGESVTGAGFTWETQS